jgi:hypothetical protein
MLRTASAQTPADEATATRAALAVTLALATALAACGGNESAAADTAATSANRAAVEQLPDPCGLLTAEEMEQVVGWRPTEATIDTAGLAGRTSCQYRNSEKWMMLMVGSSTETPDRDHYRENEDYYRETFGFDDYEFLDDVGTTTMWTSGLMTTVVPRYEVTLSEMSGGGSSLALPQARALMEKALARLD